MLISITCMGFIFQILQTSIPKVIDIRLSESLNLDTAKIGIAVSSIYIVSGLMNYIGGILADKYSEKIIFPETHAKIANVRVIITEEPATKPSIPSVKFAPLETEVIIKTTKKINTIKLNVSDSSDIHEIK